MYLLQLSRTAIVLAHLDMTQRPSHWCEHSATQPQSPHRPQPTTSVRWKRSGEEDGQLSISSAATHGRRTAKSSRTVADAQQPDHCTHTATVRLTVQRCRVVV